MDPWETVLIGSLGAIVYVTASKLIFFRAGVDDPIEASAVHGACGMWGLIAVGFFDKKQGIFNSGAFMSWESWVFLEWQLIGLLVIVAWTATLSFLYFFIAKKVNLLRVSLMTEVIGLDICEMGASRPKSILLKVESTLSAEAGKVRFAMSKPEVDKANESKEEEKPQPSAAIGDNPSNPEVHQDDRLINQDL